MGENKTIAHCCVIPPLLTVFQQWTGTNAINYYATPHKIFASIGISSTTASLLATGIYGVVKFVVTCLVLAFLIESWSCKRTLFYGRIAQGLMNLDRRVCGRPSSRVIGSEVAQGYLPPAVMSLASSMTWVFTYVIAQITWGTYVDVGVASVVPETTGVRLEDVKRLFEGGLWRRRVQDAPGGRWVLGKGVRRA